MGWLLLCLSSLLWVACTPINPPAVSDSAPWGATLTLAQAEQAHAPALWVANDRVTAAWIGADTAGVHQDTRVLTRSALSETVVLPLPPVHPYAQTIFPGQFNLTHFLWLDADEGNENRLYAALITPDLEVERGPTVISTAHTLRYTALPAGDGSLQIVWSGGLLAEPRLYRQTLDAAGRPGSATALTVNADWPTLSRANDGTHYLFWLRPSDNRLFSALLDETGLTQVLEIDAGPQLAPGTRLLSLHSALDDTHLYLFWNTRSPAGILEAWFISREINGTAWSPPALLTIAPPDLAGDAAPLFETGFNTGSAFAVQAGDSTVTWAVPLSGQYGVLPVAAQVGDDIALVYIQAGQIRGYQPIERGALIGLPGLQVDQDRYLYLAWAQPGAAAQAELRLASLRLNTWEFPRPD